MKTPEQSAQTGRTIGRVFQIILLGGLIVVAVPFISGMEDGIGVIVIGCFICLMGLIGTVVMARRTKVMNQILSGDTIIDRWEDPEHGAVILSTEGFYFSEELYTMTGYSCYISKAEATDNQLKIQYHMARKNGHSRHKTTLSIPSGHDSGVQEFIEAVRLAWGDKPLPYDREEANRDLDENSDDIDFDDDDN